MEYRSNGVLIARASFHYSITPRLLFRLAGGLDTMSCASSLRTETVAEALRRGEAFLREKGADRPRTSSEELLSRAVGLPRFRLFLDLRRPLRPDESESYETLLSRRAEGWPLAYLIGSVGFHDLILDVGPGVFIPRPETEMLVEAVREWFAPPAAPRLLDLCCGSGALALALARALPGASLFASDVSAEALAFARRNAARGGAEGRVEFREGDLFAPWGPQFRESFDAVVSNPPYIRSSEIDGLAPEVSRHEPLLALDGGKEGLAVIERIVRGSGAFLRPGGRLIFEIGAEQGVEASALCRAQPSFEAVSVGKDLAGRDRVVTARKNSDQ
jgi:release factor glutamine methyltransferase